MNSNRSCAFVLFAGILVGTLVHMANACSPGLEVTLDGPDPDWIRVGTQATFDATATGGTVGSWRYYVWPGGDFATCDCPSPCGDPPPRQYSFTIAQAYNVCVDVEETDEFCETLDSASDSKTVYTHALDLSCSAYIPVNNDNDNNNLRPLTAVLTSHDGGGEARLSYSGAATIKVYREVGGDPKGQLLTLPWSWPRSHGPVPSLYVEGISASSALNDSHLTLSYVRSGSAKDSTTVSFTVLDLDITEPDGSPLADNHFAFDTNANWQQAKCEIPVSGTSGVPSLNTSLQWAFPWPDGVLDCDTVPSTGPIVTLTYTGLPLNNSDFGTGGGQNLITLYIPGCSYEDTQGFELFYSRDAVNHEPEQGQQNPTPNWYHYWKNGGVVADLAAHNFLYENSDVHGRWTGTELHVGNKAPTSSSYTITFKNKYYHVSVNTGPDGIADTSAVTGDTQSPEIPVGQGFPRGSAITAGQNGKLDSTPPPGSDDGPLFGGTVLHTGDNGICETPRSGDDVWVSYGGIQMEVGHGVPFQSYIFWGPDDYLDSADYNAGDQAVSRLQGDDDLTFTYAVTAAYNISFSGIDNCAVTCTHELKHMDNDQHAGTDSDNDTVKDDWEDGTWHLNPKRPDTYDVAGEIDPEYYRFGDDEFLCRMSEVSPGPGSRTPGADWSDTNGKNWTHPN